MDLYSMNWAGIFSTAFLSIVFLQSGLDKVINYKQELGWIQQKFVRNPLYKFVGVLFLFLTLFEVLSGMLTFFGVVLILIGQDPDLALAGVWVSVLTLLMLIFGQRITKDYTGSATLVPYFIAGVLALHFLS
ncbi:MAG: DoxX family protein [Bacteroidia bacterium]